MNQVLMSQSLLAAGHSSPAGPEFGEASPIGLFLVLLLLVATILLVRSMNAHLKRLPESFDEPSIAQEVSEAPASEDTSMDRDNLGVNPAQPGVEPGSSIQRPGRPQPATRPTD